MPVVQGAPELEPRISTLPGSVGDRAHEVLGLEGVDLPSIGHSAGAPSAVTDDTSHEIVRDAHAVICILKLYCSIGFAVDGVVVTQFDQLLCLLFFLWPYTR